MSSAAPQTWHRWEDWAIALGFALYLAAIACGWLS